MSLDPLLVCCWKALVPAATTSISVAWLAAPVSGCNTPGLKGSSAGVQQLLSTRSASTFPLKPFSPHFISEFPLKSFYYRFLGFRIWNFVDRIYAYVQHTI